MLSGIVSARRLPNWPFGPDRVEGSLRVLKRQGRYAEIAVAAVITGGSPLAQSQMVK